MAVFLVLVALALSVDRLPTLPEIRRRRARRLTSLDRTNAEARFLAAMASELRAGAALRGAFESASQRAPELRLAPLVRLSLVGVPISDLSRGVSEALQQNGKAAAAAMRIAGETGGRTAAMFESLAQVAAEDRTLQRELRAATAQAKVSSLIVGGLPVVFLGWQALSGRLFGLASTPIGVGILVVGLALLGSGASAVTILLRKAVL